MSTEIEIFPCTCEKKEKIVIDPAWPDDYIFNCPHCGVEQPVLSERRAEIMRETFTKVSAKFGDIVDVAIGTGKRLFGGFFVKRG